MVCLGLEPGAARWKAHLYTWVALVPLKLINLLFKKILNAIQILYRPNVALELDDQMIYQSWT